MVEKFQITLLRRTQEIDQCNLQGQKATAHTKQLQFFCY